MKKLFLFSGLGADKRVFEFLDLSSYSVQHIEWIHPFLQEQMEKYAERLLPQITAENPVLIGVSFGGMIALEVAKLIPVEKVILISSARSAKAIPSYFKLIKTLKIDKVVPPRFAKKPNPMIYWLFGIKTKEHKALLAAIMRDTDETFLSWAVESVGEWKNETRPSHLVQIHGNKDRILSCQDADYLIDGGGHLMIIDKADQVSNILKKVIA